MDRRQMLGLAGAGGLALRAEAAVAQPLDPSATSVLDAMTAQAATVGGALVAVRDGRTVASYYWGSASLPFDAAVDEQTLFHLGSNGKLVTALAVIQLSRAHGIDLDDRIGRHLEGLPDVMAAVPISRLLNHTSGLADYADILSDWDRAQTRDAIQGAVAGLPVQFQAGEAWSYSNTNYVILGWLIEALSGLGYGDYVKSRLFDPAGLPTARTDASEQIIRHRAEPHLIGADGTVRHAVRMEDGVSRAADGGILMSARDVGPWRAALDRNRLISAEDMARVLQPAPLATGRVAPYGYGVFLEKCRGQPLLAHGGAVPGFVSQWMTWPAADLSILAMSNSEAAGGRQPVLKRMIAVMAEAVAPGISWLNQEPESDGSDARTAALLRLITREPEAPVPEGLLAPEIANVVGAQPRPVSGIERLVPLESWFPGQGAGQGEMTRYRFERAGTAREFVVGWTPDNQIYWI